MPISLGPSASGLPKDIVERLMDAEREPVRQLESKKKDEQAKLKLAQDLVAKVNGITAGLKEISRFKQFRDLKADVGRPDLAEVTVDKSIAEPGNYQLEVMQLSGHASMISNGLPDPDETQVGTGYFSYTLPSGEKKEVYVDDDNSTLNGIAKLINSQKDMNLTAIVVDDGTGEDNPFRLIVSHKNSGEKNDAEFPDFYFVDGDEDFYMDKDRAAQNSVLKVNGFPVEFDSNKITTLFPGVTINLKDAAPGKEFNVAVTTDPKSSKGKVQEVIGKINEVLSFIQSQNKLDKDSNTRTTLGGDVTLQTLEYKIRQLALSPIDTSSGPIRLSDLGVTFNRNGLLDIKQEKLDAALEKDFDGVADFFTGENEGGEGFTSHLTTLITGLTRSEGVVQSRVEGIQRRIRDIDNQIENKERQLSTQEKAMKEKFARLEGTMASLKAQQSQVQGALGGGGSILGG